jgi:hypothetical protein
MPRSKVLAHDDQLDVHLGGRHETSRRPRFPTLRESSTLRASTLKVIVKVGYFRAGRVPGYLAYIERDGTAGPAARDGTTATQGYSGYMARDGAGIDGQRAELFMREGQVVDREAFVTRSQGDPRAWTLIIAPSVNGLDMPRYVREFMRQVELDLGKRLDWIAAVHENTLHEHAHVLLRGRDMDGHAFRMSRAYISQGLAERATQIATLYRELGRVKHRSSIIERGSDDPALVRLQRRLEAWLSVHAREGHER